MQDEGILSGLKVLDLTCYIAGPYCTKLLADYGAEVTKVERPDQGDGARSVGPFPGDKPHLEKSGLFLYMNTNKKSVTLDLKAEEGRRVFKELLSEADILVENFEPRLMPSLGLSYETLKGLNPRLIMLSISNFGQDGPYRDYKAYSAITSAVGGATYITGVEDQPLKLPGNLPQHMAGIQGFISCLLAVYERGEGSEGQHIDLSIAECVACNLEAATVLYCYTGLLRRRNFTRFMVGHPVGIYPCRDGHVVIIPGLGNMPLLAILVGNPELADHPLFQNPYARQERPQEFDALILPWLMEHDRKDILAGAQELGMPFGVVCTPDEVLADQHLEERDYFAEIEHPVAGRLTSPGLPFKIGPQRAKMEPAPLLGEHNTEIYCGRLGYTGEQLARLRQMKVI
jgi:crotonobetainyl-CoA:carnitine CoA-transferase CaiB-like acyl-CoA transferase